MPVPEIYLLYYFMCVHICFLQITSGSFENLPYSCEHLPQEIHRVSFNMVICNMVGIYQSTKPRGSIFKDIFYWERCDWRSGFILVSLLGNSWLFCYQPGYLWSSSSTHSESEWVNHLHIYFRSRLGISSRLLKNNLWNGLLKCWFSCSASYIIDFFFLTVFLNESRPKTTIHLLNTFNKFERYIHLAMHKYVANCIISWHSCIRLLLRNHFSNTINVGLRFFSD